MANIFSKFFRKPAQTQQLPETKHEVLPFKLDPVIVQRIETSLQATQQAKFFPENKLDPQDFPTLAELISYWGIKQRVCKIQFPYNQSDRYYDWERLHKQMAEQNMKVEKDLFAIWAAIHKTPRVILEIGTRTGNSMSNLMMAHPDPSIPTVFMIDPFNEPPRLGSQEIVSGNLQRLGISIERFHFLTGFSQDVFPKFISQFPALRFDYVLVDGSHTYEDALNDLRMVTPYVAQGGYVVVDDIDAKTLGVEQAWYEWKAEQLDSFSFQEYHEYYAFAAALKK